MPLARHDAADPKYMMYMDISTHMPLARHDVLMQLQFLFLWKFLLTCLLRGMTRQEPLLVAGNKFLLTCLLRGMTT